MAAVSIFFFFVLLFYDFRNCCHKFNSISVCHAHAPNERITWTGIESRVIHVKQKKMSNPNTCVCTSKWLSSRRLANGWNFILLLPEYIQRVRNNGEKLMPFSVYRSFFVASLFIAYRARELSGVGESNTFSNSMHDKFKMSFNYAQIENHNFFFLNTDEKRFSLPLINFIISITITGHSSLNYDMWLSKKNRQKIEKSGENWHLKQFFLRFQERIFIRF